MDCRVIPLRYISRNDEDVESTMMKMLPLTKLYEPYNFEKLSY